MVKWRFVDLETNDAFANMAIDEAILQARIKKSVPNTLRIYRWQPSAVSIGRFQVLENEVVVENCRKSGADIVRRISGGGSVYHDEEGEITYSVVADKEELAAGDLGSIYAKIYAGVAEALNSLGIISDFESGDARKCPNLTVHGKKLSGSSQCHKGKTVLQHGTLLLNVDFDKMFKLLRVPWTKDPMELIAIAKNRLTSISYELDRKVSYREVGAALVKGFEKTMESEFHRGELTTYERNLSKELMLNKYSREDWNLKGKASF